MPDPFLYGDVHERGAGGGFEVWNNGPHAYPGHSIASLRLTIGQPVTAGGLHQVRMDTVGTGAQAFAVTLNAGETTAIATTGPQPAADAVAFNLRFTSTCFCPPLCTINSSVEIVFNDASPIPPPACQHGTRIKPGMPAAQILNDTILTAALALIPGEWLAVLLNIFIGNTIDVDFLCGQLPEEPLPIALTWLRNPGEGALVTLRRVLWPYFCECVPGTPAPRPPDDYEPDEPTGWPPSTVYACDPEQICVAINNIQRKLDEVLRIVGVDLQVDNFMQRRLTPELLVPGVTHPALTGEGSVAVEGVIGVRIVITERLPGRELEGAPHYVWDLGWASIMDDLGFIQERRITREVEIWAPPFMSDATTFGYSFKEGVKADVTMLYPPD